MTDSTDTRWRLPDGIEEVLPETAWQLERLRAELLGLFHRWGYDFVIPPLIEYLDSLLIGAGHDLDLDTFKLVDQLSGRMMGVRADITPQVARIDAHRLDRDGPVRLCYLGAVLHTRPGPFGGGRSPLQLGAELYGHGGLAADLEVLELLLETVEAAAIAPPLTLDLGHVGIVRALADHSALGEEDRAGLVEMLQRKSVPEIETRIAQLGLAAADADMWLALAELNGDLAVLDAARDRFAPAGRPVAEALEHLATLGRELAARRPDIHLHFDPAELRGYRYHTGVVFALYAGDGGDELARGGRYDGIGEAFGRARPATGFSTDLRRLAEAGTPPPADPFGAIAAPVDDDPALAERVRELRSAGERVIVMLPDQSTGPGDMGCDRRLVRGADDWILEEL